MKDYVNTNTDFAIGDIVYLKTDPQQFARMVTAYRIEAGGRLTYELSLGDQVCLSETFEISTERDMTIIINGSMFE